MHTVLIGVGNRWCVALNHRSIGVCRGVSRGHDGLRDDWRCVGGIAETRSIGGIAESRTIAGIAEPRAVAGVAKAGAVEVASAAQAEEADEGNELRNEQISSQVS